MDQRFGDMLRLLLSLKDFQKIASSSVNQTFMFPIVSSLGYVNEDMNRLLKFMQDCFKQNQSRDRRSDGLAVNVLKGRL